MKYMLKNKKKILKPEMFYLGNCRFYVFICSLGCINRKKYFSKLKRCLVYLNFMKKYASL